MFSCLDKSDQVYIDCIDMFITEAENYINKLKIPDIIKDKEKEYFDFILKCYHNSGSTPSKTLLVQNFPELDGVFEASNAIEISSSDLRVYIFQLIDARVNKYISKRMDQLNGIVKDHGITEEIADEFNRLQKISNRNKAKDIRIDIDARSIYNDMKNKPLGLKTGIKAIDDKIGGMNGGTVTTIAGFTSQYKTTFALNIARINSYFLGYNIAYISLETPKQDMYWNLLSSQSYETHLSKFNFVPHDRMRQCKLTPDEESFIFDEVVPDLNSNFPDNGDGREIPRGKIVFLDESDFESFSFGEITAALDNVDEQLKRETGNGLDAVIVDYIQLCKFSGSGMTYDANAQINSYVTFFRRLAQNFKKEVDLATGKEKVRMVTMILLSQINRDNWRRARNNEGRYDITCLADANELERGSYRVFTTFTTEEMKARKSAQVQILKNRTGQTMYDPSIVYADGESYTFMDEDSMTQVFGGDQTASLEAAFSELDSIDALLS